tara:strand:- start:263 stop:1144 length:882 start_codon:yes stop_codon:yes gene_type:complete
MNFNKQSTYDNYYSILGLQPNSSLEEIKKAYRKLSLDLHPDRNSNDPNKAEKYKQITAAYTILSNSKDKHDNNLQQCDSDNIINILNKLKQSHIFQEVFSNIGTRSLENINNFENNTKPKTINKIVTISLSDAFKGIQMPILIHRWLIEDNIKIEQEETIYIDIPCGIDDNEIITLEGKGNRLNNFNKGDIEIKIRINNNTDFERKGLDIIYKKSITLKQALCGFFFDLIHINGKSYTITNSIGNIIHDNYKKELSGLGFQRNTSKGNLYIIFNIIYPNNLAIDQIKKLENIL